MNREHVLFHLQEAEQELARTINEVRQSPEYDIGEYWVAMQHLYHHLNTAWNARDATPEQVQQVTDAVFQAWSKYPDPDDLPPLGSMLGSDSR
jgi:hypothetical protein